MSNFDDIINNDDFETLVSHFAGVARETITAANYELDTKHVGPYEDDLAIQEVRFSASRPSDNKKFNLERVRFYIVHRPEQEDRLDPNDAYAKRSFPNYFYLVHEKTSGGVCEVRQMTGTFEREKDKITVADLKTARKLIENLADEGAALENRINEAKAQIAAAEETIDWARGVYDEDCEKLLAAARVTPAQERE